MVSNQQFRLKWNNHRNTVLQEFGTLLHNNSFVDCTIGAEGKYVKAHKIILSACSPYFQNVFSEHFDKHPVVLLKDVLFKELKCMIDYMYCGEVNISECELPSFLRTAQSLKIKGLAEDISEYDSASDSEQAVSSYSENSRTVEANVEIHDDDGPPAKKSSTPCILSTKIVNDSMAGRKRKSPNSTVPSAGKSNSQARVGTVKVSNSTKSDEFSNSGTETEISSQCSASKEDISPEDNDSSRKAPSQNDLREPSKKAEVKEEPVENDIDNDDNSSYECGNNICEDTDPLNEDSESNCANSGNKFSEVSIASVSSYNENDANGTLMSAIQGYGEISIFPCVNPNKGFSKSSMYAIKNGCYGPFSCPRCNNHYVWKKNLIRHMKLECGKEPTFQCPLCPLRTKHKSSLIGHVRNKHLLPYYNG